jgi:ribosomal protein S12 methylthiotransferase accessory factor
MNLLSKDSPLETTLTKMQSALKNAGCETTFSQEKHPLANCYSINIASAEAPSHIYANGKGSLSDASMASALGEYIERLQTNNFFIDFHLPKRHYYPDEVAFDFDGDYLNEELLAIYDPNEELTLEELIDFNSDDAEQIISLPFHRVSDGAKTYFPINILSNLYVSNGLATGNSPKEAQVQALSEIVERYVKIEIIKNGYALPAFDAPTLTCHERVNSDINALRELGYIVEVLDASLGGVFPVVAISLINPKTSTLFVSFGAHPIFEVALERTMTELMQGRDLDNLDSFEVPTFDMSLVSDSFNLESHFIDSNGKMGFGFLSSQKSFTHMPWSYKGTTTQEEYDHLIDILHAMNKEIYLREYDYLGFYSCQIVVPDFSEVYPIEDLLFNNKNRGKEIRDMVLHFEAYDAEDILTSVENLEDSLNMEKYIGVIFAHNFSMAEFKTHIYLTLGMHEEALESLLYTNKALTPVLSELLKMQDAGAKLEHYTQALGNIFGVKALESALKILNNEESFIDVTLHKEYTNMLAMYDRLELKKGEMVA